MERASSYAIGNTIWIVNVCSNASLHRLAREGGQIRRSSAFFNLTHRRASNAGATYDIDKRDRSRAGSSHRGVGSAHRSDAFSTFRVNISPQRIAKPKLGVFFFMRNQMLPTSNCRTVRVVPKHEVSLTSRTGIAMRLSGGLRVTAIGPKANRWKGAARISPDPDTGPMNSGSCDGTGELRPGARAIGAASPRRPRRARPAAPALFLRCRMAS